MSHGLRFIAAPNVTATSFLSKVPVRMRMPLFGNNALVFSKPNVLRTGVGTVRNSRIVSRRV